MHKRDPRWEALMAKERVSTGFSLHASKELLENRIHEAINEFEEETGRKVRKINKKYGKISIELKRKQELNQ